MKAYLIIIGLVVSLNCHSQKNNRQNKQNTDISFVEFASIFNILKLPFEIQCLTDFEKYGDKDWKLINGKTIAVPNSLCPKIPVRYYKFIKDKYPINKEFYYQSVYKKVLKDYVLLIIEQVDKRTDDYFLKLNTYSLSGRIIDTLTLAGQKIDEYNQFCRIDSCLNIKIRKLTGSNEYSQVTDSWLKFETKEEYLISNDGSFKQTYFKQKKGYFTFEGKEVIPVDNKR